ncbi:hypothetical protein DFH07DRAFT_725407, partial [Mycena maculata]
SQMFTILSIQPHSTGLQVLTSENKWIEIPPLAGHLIVNLGSQIAHLTNDVFRTAPHRVLTQRDSERNLMAVFFYANMNLPLE